MDIYFKDLTPEAQARALREVGAKDAESVHWNLFPLGNLNLLEDTPAQYVRTLKDGTKISVPCMVNFAGRLTHIAKTDDSALTSPVVRESVVIYGDPIGVYTDAFGNKNLKAIPMPSRT